MEFNFYYRGTDKKLHQLLVSDEDDLQSARQAVMEHLHSTKEIFLKPLLCFIKNTSMLPISAPKEFA